VDARLSRLSFPAAVAGVTALSHAPFIGSGLGMDEGGYAYVAWRWSQGARLYGSAWIDRPQGLMLLYRGIEAVSLDPRAIRAAALLCSFVTALALASIAGCVRGRRAAIITGLTYAAVSASPLIEGFTLNGEVPAACWSAIAIALALRARQADSVPVGALAGLSAVLAISTKQSGFDGLAVASVVLARGPRRPLIASASAASLSALAFALHGALTGWQRYWFAVAGYKLHASSGPRRSIGSQLGRLEHTSHQLWHDERWLILLALLLAARALGGRGAAPLLPFAWIAVAALGVASGGQYWAHYYIELLPPLVLAAGLAIADLPKRWTRALAVTLAVAPIALTTAPLMTGHAGRHWRSIPYANRGDSDARLAALVRGQTPADGTLLVLGGDPSLYYLARRRSTVRFLWPAQFADLPAARAETRSALDGPRYPSAVVTFMGPAEIGRVPGRLVALQERYRNVGCARGAPDRCVYVRATPRGRRLALRTRGARAPRSRAGSAPRRCAHPSRGCGASCGRAGCARRRRP
jgi:hypothetical protein